jgi:hypothetical protein
MLSLFQELKVIVLVLIIFLSGHIVCGQERDLKAVDSDISEKINFIQTCFDESQRSGRMWSYGWIGVYGALTGLQGVAAIHTDHNRLTNIVGASESLLGLAVLIIDPFHARSSGSDLRALPESTSEELKLKLEKAESWLERNYKQEKLGRSWLVHAGVVAGSMLEGGAVWHDDGFKSGVISFLAGVAVGEIQIWTQPTRGIRDYNDYHNKYKGAYHNVPKTKYFIAPSPMGLVAGVFF